MAIYYLDPIDGNDSNNGISLNTAWLTYAFARQQITAGDTIYVLPGISNEQVLLLYSGTALAPIEWIFCPDGVDNKNGNIIIDRKGKCLISSFDNSGNVVNANAQFNFNSKNYINIYGLEIEHIIANGILTNGNNCIVYNCKSYNYSNQSGIASATNSQTTNNNTAISCTVIGGHSGIRFFNKVIKCKSYNDHNSIANCIYNIMNYAKCGLLAFADGSGDIEVIYLNNTSEHSQNSFYFNGTSVNKHKYYNNLSLNSYVGMYIASSGANMINFINHYNIHCSIPYLNAASNTLQLDVNDTYIQVYNTLNSGVRYTGTPIILTSQYWKLHNKLPIVIQNQDYDNTVTLESYGINTDLENQPLDLIDGIRKVGAIQQSLLSFIDEGIKGTDYYETKNTIKIHRKGIFKKTIRLNKGIHIISAWLRYDLQGGTNRPQLLIRDSENNKLVNNSDTTVSSGIGFRYIETSFTVKQDGEIVFMFFNRETHVDSYCIISDLKII